MHAERGHDLNHRRRLRLGPRRRRRFHSRESRRPEPACGRGAAGRQPGRIRLHRNPAKTGAACADRLRRNPTRPAYRHARTRSGASPRLPPARRTAAWMPGFESGHDGGCVRARRAGDRPASARAAFGFVGLRRERGPFAALDFSGKRLRGRSSGPAVSGRRFATREGCRPAAGAPSGTTEKTYRFLPAADDITTGGNARMRRPLRCA